MASNDDRNELLAIALAMKRISDQRLRRARDDLVRAELDMFRIKQEIEEAEARLAAAKEEERAREEGEGEEEEEEGAEAGGEEGEGDGKGELHDK